MKIGVSSYSFKAYMKASGCNYLDLCDLAKAMGYDVNTSVSLASYADDETVSTYAKTAMQWAVAEGIISGRSGNKLAAKSNASRAEVATMICNFAENVAK